MTQTYLQNRNRLTGIENKFIITEAGMGSQKQKKKKNRRDVLCQLRRELDNEREVEELKTLSLSWLGVSASVEGKTRKT